MQISCTLWRGGQAKRRHFVLVQRCLYCDIKTSSCHNLGIFSERRKRGKKVRALQYIVNGNGREVAQTTEGALAQDVQRFKEEANALAAAGWHAEALGRYRQALALRPGDGELNYYAGFAAWRAGNVADAGEHFRRAAQYSPNHPATHQALALWALSTADVDTALRHSERAMLIAPNEPEVLSTHAAALAAVGELDQAWSLVGRLLAGARVPPRALALYGQLASRHGDETDALRRALSALQSQGLGPEDLAQLHFTAAGLLDSLGRYDEAFSHASAAHAANRRPYDPSVIERQVERQIEYFTPPQLHHLPTASHGSLRPIFIIGMPRSGTSLVEQILASHPQVHGGGELSLLNDISEQAAQAEPPGRADYPGCLDAMSLRGCNELARQYLAGILRLNAAARYVTDKMPTNFFFLGTIRMLFPDCHVIHCVREPLDTCLSCYMTDFAMGHEFAQDLRHAGQFYRQYRRLLGHWRDRLNYPMIEVQYELLVSNLEREVGRLLEMLDLPPDPRCLKFHENPRRIATASAHQVRQPLYTRSVGRWRRYEPHLGALIEGLGDEASCGNSQPANTPELVQL